MKKYFYIITLLNLMYISQTFAMQSYEESQQKQDHALKYTYDHEQNQTWHLRRDLRALEKITKQAESKLNTLNEQQIKKLEWHHGAVETAVKETIQKYEEARQAILKNDYSKMESCLTLAKASAIKMHKELLDYKNNVKEILKIDIDAQAKL